MEISLKDKLRFWRKVRIEKLDECWDWRAAKSNGYGLFVLNRKQVGAHRVSWMIRYGEIPEGLFVCHSCDNPCCVNPSHLWLGTAKENTQDAKKKGRLRGGLNNFFVYKKKKISYTNLGIDI